jgi:TetR/AcrR family transcriptional regulator
MKDSTPRLSADARREQILDAAALVFGERGYGAGTTDEIARAAGISQAYVVRMFGSKENLYLEVTRRAAERVAQGFRGAIAHFDGTEDPLRKQRLLGQAYADLIADRTVLMTLQHLFSMGHDHVLGPVARECFLMTYRVVREEAGLSAEDAASFFGRGMLINVLMTLQLPQRATGDPSVDELIECTFPPRG